MQDSSTETYVLPSWMRSWERFWFTPADPSVLALIRITCGVLVVYTLFVYTLRLQDYMGEHAWHDLEYRREVVRDYTVLGPGSLLRQEFTEPGTVYARGMSIFSLWFHVTDPDAMFVLHALIVMVAILFTLGFCTRFTAALTWFASLSYMHRNPSVLFGADTMMNILLLYLMLSPCGAVYSVDQWLRRWWSQARPDVIRRWGRFFGRPIASDQETAPPSAPVATAEPSISANVAIRLLQVHLGMIYLIAGLSKLLGQSWWNGNAIWLTIANYEFAPMQNSLYMDFLQFLGGRPLVYFLVVNVGGLFTLAFEIGYIFLIWRPKWRWVFLGSALVLHGLIGVLMGLTTFALMMAVMNLVFVRKEEVAWLFSWVGGGSPRR
jgi:hypothetical protein